MTHSIRRTLFSRRWAAAYFLGYIKNKDDEEPKETYGFPTQKPAPFVEELKEFSSEVTRLIDETRWRKHYTNPVQQNLRATLRDIQNKDDKMFVKSDKGASFYLMKPEDYGGLLRNSVTSLYRKTSLDEVNDTLKADKKIAEELELEDRIMVSTPREAFGLLKDGKDDFRENPTIRLINPTKPELGRVSKKLVEDLVTEIKEKTKLCQWKNTLSCLQWFDKIQDKDKQTFMKLDINNYYESISKALLDETFVEIDEKTKKKSTSSANSGSGSS